MGEIGKLKAMLEYIIANNQSYYITYGKRKFDDQYAMADYAINVAPFEVSLDYHQQLSASFTIGLPFVLLLNLSLIYILYMRTVWLNFVCNKLHQKHFIFYFSFWDSCTGHTSRARLAVRLQDKDWVHMHELSHMDASANEKWPFQDERYYLQLTSLLLAENAAGGRIKHVGE